jgi:hypothetical protein
MLLRRAAMFAGMEAGSADLARIHPHGIRHLAGKWAQARGIPLPIIQAVMGHGSLSTTGQYVEEHDPTLLCLAPAAGAPQEPSGDAAAEGAPIILDAPEETAPATQRSTTTGIEPGAATEPSPAAPESAK